MANSSLESVEGVVLVLLVVGLVLWRLLSAVGRSRPNFSVGRPVLVAFGLRMAAIAGVSAAGLSSTLRGGDETTFLNQAQVLSTQPLGHGDWPHGIYQLQTVLFSFELRAGFISQAGMRILQVGLAMLGVILILAAVHDLSDGRSARLAAWVMAFEPGSVFFNSALHKEPLMELAAGLVVFGGTRLWLRLDIRGILICAVGGLIAIETRAYAGWFLVAAAVLILLIASIRSLDRPMRAMPLIYGVIAIAFVATPAILQASSKKSLSYLQTSQDANSTGQGEQSATGNNGSNLALEKVNFSTRGAIITNLPKRIRDLILKPYPWQLGDTSQRFGALGTLYAYAILFLLLRYAWLARRRISGHLGPILYPMLFMLMAYSLSAGNAGTGFRYRTHLVTLATAAMTVAWARARGARAVSDPEISPQPSQPILRRVASPV
jgi:hypothetical protein